MKTKRHKKISQAELHERLETAGWWRPFGNLTNPPRRELDEPEAEYTDSEIEAAESKERNRVIAKLLSDPNYRRRWLRPDSADANPRKTQPEFYEGKCAFWSDEKKSTNPYNKQSLSWELWNEGWELGMKVANYAPERVLIRNRKLFGKKKKRK